MVVRRVMLIVGLSLVVLAPQALGSDDALIAPAAAKAIPAASDGDDQAGDVSAAFVVSPQARTGAKRKPAPRTAGTKSMPRNARREAGPAERLAYSGARVARGQSSRSASQPSQTATAEPPAMRDVRGPAADYNVRQAQYAAAGQGPPFDPGPGFGGGPAFAAGPSYSAATAQSEPIGFSGARFQPSMPVDPSLGASMFEDPVEMSDPLDIEAPAPAVSSREWLRKGYWYTQQSAVFMSRSTNVKNSTVLSTDFSSSSVAHYLNFLQIPIDPGFRPGVRSTVGRYIGRDARNRDHSVEFTFLGFANWKTAGGLDAAIPGNIFSNIDPAAAVTGASTPVFNAANTQTFAEASSFDSYELNYVIDRRPVRDQMVYTRDSTWIRRGTPSRMPAIFAGIRVVTINERLNYLSSSSVGNGTYNIFTHNNLVGPQAGFDWFFDHNDWRLGTRLKGGAMVNWTNQTTSVQILDFAGAPLVPNRNQHASDNIFAFVGEINFIGAYRLRPNFAIRVSYDLMWVTSLALAQNQLNFTPTPIAIDFRRPRAVLSRRFDRLRIVALGKRREADKPRSRRSLARRNRKNSGGSRLGAHRRLHENRA